MKSRKLGNNLLQPNSGIFIALLGPPVIIFMMATIVPLVIAGYISLHNWGGGSNNVFIGVSNYINAFKDYTFWRTAYQTLIITLINLVGQVGIAFVVSFLMFSKITRFKGFHRRVVFFPVILSAMVVGIIWKIIYNSRYGPLNTALRALGQDGMILKWLADTNVNLLFVSIPVIWEFVGLYALMLMGVLSNIPEELFEVAELDGASGLKKAVYVIIPVIYKTVTVCITICFAGTLRIFDQIVAMTNGGPGSSTMTMAIYAYQVSFNYYKLGSGSAIAILMMALIAISTLLVNRLLRGDRFE